MPHDMNAKNLMLLNQETVRKAMECYLRSQLDVLNKNDLTVTRVRVIGPGAHMLEVEVDSLSAQITQQAAEKERRVPRQSGYVDKFVEGD